MNIKIFLTFFFLTLFALYCSSYSQSARSKFSVGVNTSYTTTSKLFFNPEAEDLFLKNEYFPLNDIWSVSFNFRYRINNSVIGELNIERIRKTAIGQNMVAATSLGTRAVKAEDGYEIFPIELNLLYVLPFSTETIQIYMGGGVGTYFGKQIRAFGNVKTESQNKKFAYGIQVLTGISYSLFDFLSARFEMRFRDPEIKLTTKYLSETAVYKGRTYILPKNSFHTKVDIDGVTFTFGLALNF